MQPRTSAILLAVALALGAFVYFYEIGGEDARREAEEQARRLFPAVEQEAIEWIALTTRDGIEARLERGEGGWRLVQPVAFSADRFAADGMAANLAGLVSEAALENPQPLAEYDLGEAARTVHFSAGGQERALLLGGQTPVGDNAYAKTGASDAVYTVHAPGAGRQRRRASARPGDWSRRSRPGPTARSWTTCSRTSPSCAPWASWTSRPAMPRRALPRRASR
jgi:hypothetical protein